MSFLDQHNNRLDEQAGTVSMSQELMRMVENFTKEPAGTLKGDERLADLQYWDSLAALDLILAIEKQFGIAVELDAIVKCSSVGDLLRLVTE